MNKSVLMAADPAGFGLKEAVKKHLLERGFDVTDFTAEGPMDYHKAGFAVGKAISSKEYERALIFCGSGMGVHIVAGKFPGVYCAVCESPWPANRCRAINNCNVLAMGGFFITERYGCMMADQFLDTEFLEGFDQEDIDFLSQAFAEIQEMEKEIYNK